MALLIDVLNKIHIKNTDFFLTKYKDFNQDIENSNIKSLTDIQIECLGYGIFKKQEVLHHFHRYLMDMFRTFAQKQVELKTLKITFNGFDISEIQNIFLDIANGIQKMPRTLRVLWIHTANLKGCRLKDFEALFSLMFDLTDLNFEDFSLQCANWKFHEMQPKFSQVLKVFLDQTERIDEITKLRYKFWRLEISGWYYSENDAKNLLGFNGKDQHQGLSEYNEETFARERQKFHIHMENLLKQLLEGMDNIQELELDMRNFHEILKMKNLKKKLDNVTKQNTYERSIMSKRYDIQADEAERQLKLSIVM